MALAIGYAIGTAIAFWLMACVLVAVGPFWIQVYLFLQLVANLT